MNIKSLITLWESTASGKLTDEKFTVQLPLEDAAKLYALAEIYPRRSINEIITDLLSASLDDVESQLPYIKGSEIIGTDEEGDPIYEDIGPTPRFLALSQKHVERYRQRQH